ncbi:peptidyl-Asp metalloendopeptidase [Pilimelia terevasa]|uniref:Peptidyl-Asp metalloendopeptidase n=1 Tax=Pilimelia terevasa TaxID=53372 RepID=A0A8J3BNG3_9ACTN|nr:M12 family metallo-peptidase [Pilimelia terevasa]GGK34261.1 peptidyl-Asp metalloendopeptidase [Pilimelia terevasa]
MLVTRGLAAIAGAATAALGLSLAAAPARAADLPALLTGAAPQSRAAGAARAALAAAPTVAAVALHRADPGVVRADTDRLGLRLGAGAELILRRDWTAPLADGGLTWAGRVGDTDDTATLVRRADGVTGTVRSGADLYRIQPVPGVGHAVVRVDEDARPPDHPADALAALTAPAAPADSRPAPAPAGPAAPNTTIRVLVAASRAAIDAHTGDFRSVAELAVAETNQSYRNSDIAIDLELAGYVPTAYADSGSVGGDLNALKGRADGKLDDLHAQRDELRADVVALITEKGNACGVAPGLDVAADAAFVVATRSCATGYFTFGHEIGHLQGAGHNKAQGTNGKYAYGHGYLRDGEWRTIMAYDCPKKCKRVQHWSNPNKQYDGQALGVAGAADNARVLNQTAARIGAFRP